MLKISSSNGLSNAIILSILFTKKTTSSCLQVDQEVVREHRQKNLSAIILALSISPWVTSLDQKSWPRAQLMKNGDWFLHWYPVEKWLQRLVFLIKLFVIANLRFFIKNNVTSLYGAPVVQILMKWKYKNEELVFC